MYILDTNILIYYFKGQGNVASAFASIAPQEIAVPTIVLFELYVGIGKSSASTKRREQLGQILQWITILPFDLDTAKAAAEVRSTGSAGTERNFDRTDRWANCRNCDRS